jgi:hypothetical protein
MDIGSVTDVVAPLIEPDQDNADANGQTRKYGDFDQHLDTKSLPSCEMIGERARQRQRNSAVNLKQSG